ncbi:MAG: hypothetical protein WD649_03435, partial [Thermoleophilaceae bacterium]
DIQLGEGNRADLGGRQQAVLGFGLQEGLVGVAEQAAADGFTPGTLDDANDSDVICVLVPDDVIPSLPLTGRADSLTFVASGYTLAFDRFDP